MKFVQNYTLHNQCNKTIIDAIFTKFQTNSHKNVFKNKKTKKTYQLDKRKFLKTPVRVLFDLIPKPMALPKNTGLYENTLVYLVRNLHLN